MGRLVRVHFDRVDLHNNSILINYKSCTYSVKITGNGRSVTSLTPNRSPWLLKVRECVLRKGRTPESSSNFCLRIFDPELSFTVGSHLDGGKLKNYFPLSLGP